MLSAQQCLKNLEKKGKGKGNKVKGNDKKDKLPLKRKNNII